MATDDLERNGTYLTLPYALHYKTFYNGNYYSYCVCHCHPSLIFAGLGKSLLCKLM